MCFKFFVIKCGNKKNSRVQGIIYPTFFVPSQPLSQGLASFDAAESGSTSRRAGNPSSTLPGPASPLALSSKFTCPRRPVGHSRCLWPTGHREILHLTDSSPFPCSKDQESFSHDGSLRSRQVAPSLLYSSSELPLVLAFPGTEVSKGYSSYYTSYFVFSLLFLLPGLEGAHQ